MVKSQIDRLGWTIGVTDARWLRISEPTLGCTRKRAHKSAPLEVIQNGLGDFICTAL